MSSKPPTITVEFTTIVFPMGHKVWVIETVAGAVRYDQVVYRSTAGAEYLKPTSEAEDRAKLLAVTCNKNFVYK